MITPLHYHLPPPGRSFSVAGLLSLFLALVPAVAYVMVPLFGMRDEVMLGVCAVLGFIGAPLVGLLLGIRSLRTPGLQRGLAIAGPLVNGLFVTFLLANVLLYLVLR